MNAAVRQTGPINAPMPGVLDFFNLKTFGANPTDVSQLVSHMNDMQPFLVGGKREVFQFPVTTSTSGAYIFSPGAVPNNECWLIEATTLSVSMVGTVLAGIFNYGFVLVPGGSGPWFQTQIQAPVGITTVSGIVLPKYQLLGPGSAINFFQQSTTGAAFTAAPNAQINLVGVRLRA